MSQILDCSCLICSGIAENDEVVAVEDFIDVGNILGKSWVSLYFNQCFPAENDFEKSD